MQATLEGLAEEMARDPSIFVLGEGIGVRGGNFKTTAGLYELYGPVRLRDTPICERGFVGLGCGAAMTGTRPVIDFMFADFVLDSVGEIINQIAKIQYMSSGRLKMPILLRGCIGIGHSAATHHSGNYYPMYAHFPGLRVVVPSTPYDAKGLLKQALRSSDPVIFLEHREILGVKGPVPDEDYQIEFGRASVVREGSDVTVVALALMVHHTKKICEQLAQEGISIELIDPRTVAPLDVETIRRSVAKTGRLLIVDETFAPYGIGAEIAAQLADQGFDDLDAPIRRLNGAFTPTPYSPTLEAAVVPTPDIDRPGDPRPHGRMKERASMASEVTIPRLGWNMDEGTFVGWLKSDGEHVAAGEPLFSLEGDKATQDIESLEAGILRIPPDGPKDGEKVAVGTLIGYLVAPGEPAPFEAGSARECRRQSRRTRLREAEAAVRAGPARTARRGASPSRDEAPHLAARPARRARAGGRCGRTERERQ